LSEQNKSREKKDGVPSSLRPRRARGPRKARTLSVDQESFCNLVARGFTIEGAGARVGISNSTAWTWKRKPLVQQRIDGLLEELSAKARTQIESAYKMDVQFLDVECTRVAAMQKPHKFRGFADKNKALELGFRRLRAIEPLSTTRVTAVAGAVAMGGTMKERYKSLWLIEKEERMRLECERESVDARGPDDPPSTVA
jgi:hypothetical protein